LSFEEYSFATLNSCCWFEIVISWAAPIVQQEKLVLLSFCWWWMSPSHKMNNNFHHFTSVPEYLTQHPPTKCIIIQDGWMDGWMMVWMMVLCLPETVFIIFLSHS
jgi:hypothetical protein